MINIIITAGGTTESIDQVRKITNTSTGKLGAAICKKAIEYLQNKKVDYQIHYIVSQTAIKPKLNRIDQQKVIFYEVSDTESVKHTIETIFDCYEINFFIHSMAISDFTTSHIMPIHEMAQEITRSIATEPKDKILSKVEEVLRHPKNHLGTSKKISSESDIILTMIKTPKIINLVKKHSPNIFLVGFKLLNNVEEEELVKAAKKLIDNSQCDLVLANDLKNIKDDNHQALLIKEDEIIQRCFGKEHIAKAIIDEMFEGRINI